MKELLCITKFQGKMYLILKKISKPNTNFFKIKILIKFVY